MRKDDEIMNKELFEINQELNDLFKQGYLLKKERDELPIYSIFKRHKINQQIELIKKKMFPLLKKQHVVLFSISDLEKHMRG